MAVRMKADRPALLWIFALALLTVVAVGFRYSDLEPGGSALNMLIAAAVFGCFVGVMFVTEDERRYRRSGTRVRIASGMVAGGAIAVLFTWDAAAIAASAFVGGFLGYLGWLWIKHLTMS